ncbi:hypothetical protein D3C80_1884230 [compost metagenome]
MTHNILSQMIAISEREGNWIKLLCIIATKTMFFHLLFLQRESVLILIGCKLERVKSHTQLLDSVRRASTQDVARPLVQRTIHLRALLPHYSGIGVT